MIWTNINVIKLGGYKRKYFIEENIMMYVINTEFSNPFIKKIFP